jgi:RNA polymerase sigma-70 factor (ECF subfamily)
MRPLHPGGGAFTVNSDTEMSGRDGGREAIAALYDRLAGRLLGAALSLGCSRAEAEDIVHELFVRLARSGVLGGDVDDPDAYAFTSLRHAVFRTRQRRLLERTTIERLGREREADGRLAHADPADAPADADEGLRRALALLPEAQREVVVLKIDGGLTFAQIAKVTNVSLNTAAGRYRYALEKLRVALAVEVVR